MPEHTLHSAGEALLARWIYVLVLSGGSYVVPYTPARLAALRAAGEYEADFFPFLTRFLEALAGQGWPSGNYFPGGWYRQLKAQGQDPLQAPLELRALGMYFGQEARVDARGQWTLGPKAVTGKVLTYFIQHLHWDGDLARYFIRYQNVNYPETRYLRHDSPPYRVQGVEFAGGMALVTLNDATREPLRPASLRLDANEALYCAVKTAHLPARFEDAARFQVLDRVVAHDRGYSLRIGNQVFPITLEAPWAGADRLP